MNSQRSAMPSMNIQTSAVPLPYTKQWLLVQLRAAYAFFERNVNLSKRYWAWELVWLTYNIVNAFSVTLIAKSANSPNSVLSGAHLTQSDINTGILYLVIGTAVWSFLSTCFSNVTEIVTIEKWEGTIEYTFMAPIARFTQMAGSCAFAIMHGLLLTAVQLVVMSLFFNLDMSHANVWTAIIILLLGSLSLMGLGIMASSLPMLFTERGAQMTYIIQALLLLISGIYYPISVLPPFLQFFAHISPVTYVLEGMRDGLLLNHPIWDMWDRVFILLLAGAISIPVGLAIFNKAEIYAKKTGKLKRNG
jgi:ABC-2 type transport system permease protein